LRTHLTLPCTFFFLNPRLHLCGLGPGAGWGEAAGGALKEAPTLLASDIVTLQVVAVPKQAPDQWPKAEPLSALAVRITAVPAGIGALQV
jgi:hypothetical protein